MPKAASEVAKELRAIMRERKSQPLTLTWPFFYNFCERQKWTDKAYEETWAAAQEVGLILGYGSTVVVITEDEDFAPLTSYESP